MIAEGISVVLLAVGALFYFAGTLGLLRFPDVYCRLHALTKADNIGLGCVLLGLALRADSLLIACKLLLIWPLALLATASVGYAIARRANALGVEPWQQDRQ